MQYFPILQLHNTACVQTQASPCYPPILSSDRRIYIDHK